MRPHVFSYLGLLGPTGKGTRLSLNVGKSLSADMT
jgi:hypothetical protein